MSVRPLAAPLLALAASVAVASPGPARTSGPSQDTAASRRDYAIAPVPFTAVRLADEFWAPRIETARAVTIPTNFKKCEESGRIDNFAIAGGLLKGEYKGQRYNDTDVYKTIEGASYSLAVRPDPALDAYLDGVIAKIAAAEEPDGYLFTARTASPGLVQPGIGAERWSELAVSHELYNAGHLYEAAAAHFLATGQRTLLDVALKNADLVLSVFGPGGRPGFPGHQEIELGLVKLFRATGDRKYLDQAKRFLDNRGRGEPLKQYPAGSRFSIYNDPEQIQAHQPVLEQDKAVGHAVRLAYMAAAMADVAALAGSREYADAVDRLWENVAGAKTYLTGGIGARHDRERFGEDFELPNATAYAETCAAIGNAFWNYRMFQLHGDAKYLDLLERVVYDGVLPGVSLDGGAFFYPNPLESDGRTRFNKGSWGRAPWFDVACCPGNVARFLPSVPGYVYATEGDAVYVNLFAAGSADVTAGGRKIRLVQETRYPWDGRIRITVSPEAPAAFALMVRVPGWARDEAFPTGLYRFLETAGSVPPWRLSVNGVPARRALVRGFARVERTWKPGDVVELMLPMPIRRVVANDAVAEDRGKVALQRGPLLYCAEGVDNGGRALDLVLPDGAKIMGEPRPQLLNGIVVLTGTALAPKAAPAKPLDAAQAAGADDSGRDGEAGPPAVGRELPAGPLRLVSFTAIPYYAWAHRGPTEMAVWLWRR